MPAPLCPSDPFSCAVCGSQDARSMSSTALSSGSVIIVCGSHATAHGRLRRPARTVTELRAMLSERRGLPGHDRRAAGSDELAESLALAFSPERRRSLSGNPGRRRLDLPV